jgi:UDP-GlcNAc3NAcA epimerase
MSTLLFSPTKAGMDNLKKEGFELIPTKKATINRPNVYHCGDIMYDNSLYFSKLSEEKSRVLEANELQENKFILCTIHRDSNTDDAQKLNSIFTALLQIHTETGLAILLPLHPRTKKKIDEFLEPALHVKINQATGFKLIPPTGFLDIISLEKNAKLIITDSGGIQKEAFFFKKPCVILRDETEWIEMVANGNARLAGSNEKRIFQETMELLNKSNFNYPDIFGDGQAATFICTKILEDLLC